MILNDKELVTRVQAYDDHYAFSQLVKKYQSPLRLFLRRLLNGDEARADDLAQETFLLAYRKLERFEGRSSFATWLFAIGKNQFLQQMRKSKQNFSWEEDSSQEMMDGGFEDSKSNRMDLEEAMKVLRPIERAVITMCYFEDLTHEDVSQIMELPLGSLKTHIKRGKEKLQKALQGHQNHGSRGVKV